MRAALIVVSLIALVVMGIGGVLLWLMSKGQR